jgi:N-sulfoglucosamine sulfohydrolase
MRKYNSRAFIITFILLVIALTGCSVKIEESRPNILFCISDDQSWLHAGAMGDPVVKTPAFDRIAREGILFTNAYCDAPSCGPSRSAILTGQHIWRLEDAGNIHSRLPEKFPIYSELLENAGYAIGSYSKGWSPGMFKNDTGWVHDSRSQMNPAGKRYKSFNDFFQAKPPDQPFCFWLGSRDAHRGYKLNSGLDAGMDPSKVIVPAHLPDDPIVRNDILDYYYEVQRWDTTVWEALTVLEEAGELENTLVVVTSDNGMPFPRAKATIYDFGTRMPLAISWPARLKNPNRVYEGFVHLSDLASTFLEAAGVDVPAEMTAKSLMNIFSGKDEIQREAAYTAMERHDGCRIGGKAYPCRALRTKDYLYIRNYEPDRWPSGNPDAQYCARMIPFGEVDTSPTKTLMMEKEEEFKKFYELAFGMRPAEELYDLETDPDQINNVAELAEYSDVKEKLSQQLQDYTAETGDPRALGEFAPWDYYPYLTPAAWAPNEDWHVDERPQ